MAIFGRARPSDAYSEFPFPSKVGPRTRQNDLSGNSVPYTPNPSPSLISSANAVAEIAPSSIGAESYAEEGVKSMKIDRLPRYGVLSLRRISIALAIFGQVTWCMRS